LPTAEATRLTEPERTSPAANTRGRLVSNKNGCRFKVRYRQSPTFENAIAFRSCGHYSDSRSSTMNTQLLADVRSLYSQEDNGLKARWARRLPAYVLSAPMTKHDFQKNLKIIVD